jgi:Txe/YoeB family toxin of toxin-antitoxin system
MIIAFDPEAFEDFQAWAVEDKKVFARIGSLIKDITRNPLHGIGKPEPLKHNLSGFWSRPAASPTSTVLCTRSKRTLFTSPHASSTAKGGPNR